MPLAIDVVAFMIIFYLLFDGNGNLKSQILENGERKTEKRLVVARRGSRSQSLDFPAREKIILGYRVTKRSQQSLSVDSETWHMLLTNVNLALAEPLASNFNHKFKWRAVIPEVLSQTLSGRTIRVDFLKIIANIHNSWLADAVNVLLGFLLQIAFGTNSFPVY